MRVMEGKKGSKSALVLTMVVHDANEFMRELREAKAAILDWKGRHGNACHMLMLSVPSPVALHAVVEDTIRRLRSEEVVLAPILQTVEIRVMLLNEAAKPVREICIPAAQTAGASAAPTTKPWWKVW